MVTQGTMTLKLFLNAHVEEGVKRSVSAPIIPRHALRSDVFYAVGAATAMYLYAKSELLASVGCQRLFDMATSTKQTFRFLGRECAQDHKKNT